MIFLLFYVLVFVHAIPFVKRIVVSPQITYPKASTTWNAGDKVTVTWDTSGIPRTSNFTGQLLLGWVTGDSENLNIDRPLAQDFFLSGGSVQIIVPNVPDGSHYIVVLFGDSGNTIPQFTGGSTSPSLLVSFLSSASPQFTITGGSSTTTTLSPPSISTQLPTPITPSSPTPTSPLSPDSSSPPPTSPSSTSMSASSTPTLPNLPASSPSSSTPTPNSATAAAANVPSLCLARTANSALPLHGRGTSAIFLCVAAVAMSLVLVL
ncbi:hypothetical protein EDB84DRAFT_315031 [Lactarius hengduanensis]|nr:hypothetical protein EDB84DRAFT_315031 [Lactarius hengduanensis]